MKEIVTDTFSFERLRTNNLLYVDKTAFVWQLVGSGKFSFFLARPRRFGKSLMISTLECFFKNKRELFRGLDIERLAPEAVWQEWPVIRLDMSRTSSQNSFEEFVAKMQNVLQEAAESLGVVIESDYPNLMLQKLINSVWQKYGKGVVVLVDEYDKPILDALYKPYISDVLGMMSGFYQELKAANDKERFVFLTGVSKFAHTSIFSGFNNPTDITRNASFATMLGYTQQELETNFVEHIDEAVAVTGLTREALLRRLKVWYNGFRFSEDAPTVYNPVSIGKFFSEYKFRNYWWDTGTPSFLVEKMRNDPFALENISEKWVQFDTFGKSEAQDINPIDLALQTGYLTIAESRIEDDDCFVRYDFPNKEIRDSWYACMLAIAAQAPTSNDVKLELSELRFLLDAADVDGFMERLEWFFSGMPYENVRVAEGNFRNHLRTIFVLFGLPNQCEVQVARGRIDIVAQTRKCAFVFEVKVADTPEDVPAKIEEALQQVAAKDYEARYRAESEQVRVIALVFNRETRKIAGWKVANSIYSNFPT